MGIDRMTKRPFLTVYDYGQGGVWRVILAESEAEIATKYPELQIFGVSPEWMSVEKLHDTEARSTVDIDDICDPWVCQEFCVSGLISGRRARSRFAGIRSGHPPRSQCRRGVYRPHEGRGPRPDQRRGYRSDPSPEIGCLVTDLLTMYRSCN